MHKVSAKQLPSHPVSVDSRKGQDAEAMIDSLVNFSDPQKNTEVARLLLCMHHFGKDNANGIGGAHEGLAKGLFGELNNKKKEFMASRGGNPAQQSISARDFDEATRKRLLDLLSPREIDNYEKTLQDCSERFRHGKMTEQEIGYRLSDAIAMYHVSEKSNPSPLVERVPGEGWSFESLRPEAYVIDTSEPQRQKGKKAAQPSLSDSIAAIFMGSEQNDQKTALAFLSYLWGAKRIAGVDALPDKFETAKSKHMHSAGNNAAQAASLAREFTNEAKKRAAQCLSEENRKKYENLLKAAGASYESSSRTKEDFIVMRTTMLQGTLDLLRLISSPAKQPASDALLKTVGDALGNFKKGSTDPLKVLSYLWKGDVEGPDRSRFSPFKTAKTNYVNSEPDEKKSRLRARAFTQAAKDHAVGLMLPPMQRRYEKLLATATDAFNATDKTREDYQAYTSAMREGIGALIGEATLGRNYAVTASSSVTPPAPPSSQ